MYLLINECNRFSIIKLFIFKYIYNFILYICYFNILQGNNIIIYSVTIIIYIYIYIYMCFIKLFIYNCSLSYIYIYIIK